MAEVTSSASWPPWQVVQVENIENGCHKKEWRAHIKTSDSVITVAINQRQNLLHYALYISFHHKHNMKYIDLVRDIGWSSTVSQG